MLARTMTASRTVVFKVSPRTAWEAACQAGAFTGSPDDQRDGFIHLSLASQLAGTLAKHFRGQNELLLIQFNAHELGDALRWEISRGGVEFPHLYSALPTAIATATYALRLDDDGVPKLPEGFEC